VTLHLNSVARKVVRLGRALSQMEARYHTVRGTRRTTFYIEVPLPPQLLPQFSEPAARSRPDRACDRKAMLRGLFLGCGSVNAPSTRYHLEWVVPTAGSARLLLALAHDADLPAAETERDGSHVVYIKEGDGIVRGLSLMGASRAVMEFENVRVMRELTAQVNRRLNFETANIDKTIGSALRQLAAIDSLARSPGLERLPEALRDMARARRQNPESNLSELATAMKLSRSAVNHRLRRLVDMADAPEPNRPDR
jgi:DNA-binding protein WhiA